MSDRLCTLAGCRLDEAKYSDDFLMTAIIMAEAHGNCCSDNALYKNGLLLFIIINDVF